MVHCRDGSDEKVCRTLSHASSYNKLLPPITTDSAFTMQPVHINVTIDNAKIARVDEAGGWVEIEYDRVLEWFEPRVNYFNLKHDFMLNSLLEEEAASLWVPFLTYSNIVSEEKMEQDDILLTVTREGGFVRSDLSVAEEMEIFQGAENRLTQRESRLDRVLCVSNLSWFPFDTQVRYQGEFLDKTVFQECLLEIEVGKRHAGRVHLLPGELRVLKPMELQRGSITQWLLVQTGGRNGVNVCSCFHLVSLLL